MDRERFQNPGQEYREIPFWSWNDLLDPDELRRQIRLMKEGGWGGFFMHSRAGLRTPYMGPDWLAAVRAAVDEARSCSMQAWLYDEDKWPSGYGGGASVAGNPAHRAKHLVRKVDTRLNLLAERVATFRAREAGGVLVDICPDPAPRLSHPDDRLVQFYPAVMALGNEIFNDYAYVDLLNADAVAAFLNTTHNVYASEIGDEFGRTVPGIFTDEPCLQFHRYSYGEFGYQADDPAVPWTDDLPEFFQRENGYDLLPHLPSLFFDTGDAHKVRFDFYRTVTRLFLERFTKPVRRWCEARGLSFAGHFMGEDTLLWQIPWVGAVMPHLAHMSIPGIDKLGRSVNDFDAGMVLTVKQLDSVACQTGKLRTLCENYGCSGQDFSHAGRKWIGDWAYVLGANLNNPHMALYSMAGERKRDCPPNLFFQQPWWPENRLVSDYFARLSYALSQGRRQVDILVIHPVASAWSLYRPRASSPVIQLDRALNELLLCLMQAQRDCHLADEMLMERGEPCEGRVVRRADGPRLAVGEAMYRVVVVPPAVTLFANTVALLREFASAGGVVLAIEPLPGRVDGVPASETLPAGTRIVSSAALPAALDRVLPFDVRVEGRPTIWAHHRTCDNKEIYFLANTDGDHGYEATVQLRST
ncbi:MAG: glycoside hydrolase, partial [Anaerolineae bacterium]|nr:glycoside hydrolase [Anaerolineae bacterium]